MLSVLKIKELHSNIERTSFPQATLRELHLCMNLRCEVYISGLFQVEM